MKAKKRQIKKWCRRGERFVKLASKRGETWMRRHIDDLYFSAGRLVLRDYKLWRDGEM